MNLTAIKRERLLNEIGQHGLHAHLIPEVRNTIPIKPFKWILGSATPQFQEQTEIVPVVKIKQYLPGLKYDNGCTTVELEDYRHVDCMDPFQIGPHLKGR